MPLGLGQVTRAVFKRARRGLYAGKKILTGNNISEDGGNKCAATVGRLAGRGGAAGERGRCWLSGAIRWV